MVQTHISTSAVDESRGDAKKCVSSHVLKRKEAAVQRRERYEAKRCRDWQREGEDLNFR